MTTGYFSRFAVMVALVLLTAATGHAQSDLLPVPTPADRGAQSNLPPFYIPEAYAPSARSTIVRVTTTADEEDGTCDQAGTGLSLREALTTCDASDQYYTVFIPSGEYVLASPIDVVDDGAAAGVMLVGEAPQTTLITTAGELDYLIAFEVRASPLSVMNLSFTNSATLNDLDNGLVRNGGALRVNGGGTIVLNNDIFTDNVSDNGGAVHLKPFEAPLQVTILNTSFIANRSELDGGAIYLDGKDMNGSHLWIGNSLFNGNEAGRRFCQHGGGAITAVFDYTIGDAVTIDNSSFYQNTLEAPYCSSGFESGGGSMAIVSTDAPITVNISSSEFIANSAPNGDKGGGSIYAHTANGTLNISSTRFIENTASRGGAVYDPASAMISIDSSEFYGNTALHSGGALFFMTEQSADITHSYLVGNSASVEGGGVWLRVENAYIGHSLISNNLATNWSGSSFGGGIHFQQYGAALFNTRVEDNYAGYGPDCYSRTFTEPGGDVISLGNVGMSSTADCQYIPHETDQHSNLLFNGGFEWYGLDPKVPYGWTVKNALGDKRNCVSLTWGGFCTYRFKGGAAEKTTLIQNLDGALLDLDAGDTLRLFAEGQGGVKSNVQLIARVTYSMPGQAATTAKIAFNGSTGDGFLAKSAELTVQDSAISKIQVKIVNKSKGGKFYLDRVYLFEPGGGPVTPRATLPAPAAPSGFRGGN